MRIFVAGATGVLGRHLLRQLRARGHEVLALSRGARNEEIIRSLGGHPRSADLFDAEQLARAAEGAEVVIHAATAIPTSAKIAPQDWATNDRIHREGTRALAVATEKIGAKTFLFQSITWVARAADGGAFNEDSPLAPDFVTQSAVDGEQIARAAGAKAGFRVGVLRCGMFYAPDAAHTRDMAERLRKRALPIIGRGDAVWSLIHVADAASAFVAAAEAGRDGLWHVVDDRPVAAADVLRTFARKLGAPEPRRVPVWLAKLLAGSYAVGFLTSSKHTTNARIRRELGWTPQFPSIEEGFDDVVRAWSAEGLLAA
jgi:nucleoside-diphosphate-sugar epimerase